MNLNNFVASIKKVEGMWLNRILLKEYLECINEVWAKVLLLLITGNDVGRITKTYFLKKCELLKHLLKAGLEFQILSPMKQIRYLGRERYNKFYHIT